MHFLYKTRLDNKHFYIKIIATGDVIPKFEWVAGNSGINT